MAVMYRSEAHLHAFYPSYRQTAPASLWNECCGTGSNMIVDRQIVVTVINVAGIWIRSPAIDYKYNTNDTSILLRYILSFSSDQSSYHTHTIPPY